MPALLCALYPDENLVAFIVCRAGPGRHLTSQMLPTESQPSLPEPELAPVKTLTRREMDELAAILAPIIQQRLEKKLHFDIDQMVQESLKKHHEENEATIQALKAHVDDLEERTPTCLERFCWSL